MNTDPEPDIVEVILAACQAGGLDADAALLIEHTIRQQFGGQRVRITKKRKHPTMEARAAAFEDAKLALPAEVISQKHGVSRATIYRYLKKIG